MRQATLPEGTSSTPSVSIVEVAPRDGLQNYDRMIITRQKIRFIEALVEAGVRTIEAASFVSPAALPRMADAEQVMAGIERRTGVRYLALTPNVRGLHRALEAGVDSIALFAAASEAFSKANLNASIAETFDRFRAVAGIAADRDIWMRGYVSVAFHCPFSGKVKVEQVLPVVERLRALGCDEIALADTTGKALPEDVSQLLELTESIVPIEQTALHFHDTFGRAIDNVQAGFEAGVRTFDSSAGGIGGCPFSPGAPGNVATEQVVDFFESFGVTTGIDVAGVHNAYHRHILQQPDDER